jgi:pSer/pThr/pTyr-binding forkhead associated (FHA) protein
MAQVTLVMERTPVQVYTLDRPVLRIGRVEGMEIVIDNVSVSRQQAELRQDGKFWTVRDLDSANGTFLNGERLGTAALPLRPGDEISFGKFSLFFERVFREQLAETDVTPASGRANPVGTYHMNIEDLERLHQSIAAKRQPQIEWEVAGMRGTYVVKGGGALVGRSRLCDLRLPAGGPKQHLLIIRGDRGFEARNLSLWHRMKVNGQVMPSATLKSNDRIEFGPVRLTFLDEI